MRIVSLTLYFLSLKQYFHGLAFYFPSLQQYFLRTLWTLPCLAGSSSYPSLKLGLCTLAFFRFHLTMDTLALGCVQQKKRDTHLRTSLLSVVLYEHGVLLIERLKKPCRKRPLVIKFLAERINRLP